MFLCLLSHRGHPADAGGSVTDQQIMHIKNQKGKELYKTNRSGNERTVFLWDLRRVPKFGKKVRRRLKKNRISALLDDWATGIISVVKERASERLHERTFDMTALLASERVCKWIVGKARDIGIRLNVEWKSFQTFTSVETSP